MKYYLSVLLLCSCPLYSSAEQRQFTSSPEQSQVIELYTSEGCSSCPPAEKYMNQLRTHPQLWKTVIPVVFHVDYWDYLGWKDRFSHPDYSNRQRQYAKQHASRKIYTPAFFINGKSWRPGLFNREPPQNTGIAGVLRLDIEAGHLTASYQPASSTQAPRILNIALLGMDISSRIIAGENTGLESRHDFVVLSLRKLNSDNLHWQTLLQLPPVQAQNYAIAAWVSNSDELTPIQATGGWIPADYLQLTLK